MAADVSSAVAGDTTDPQGLATIPEDSQYADTANAKEMDANDEETTENSSKHINLTSLSPPPATARAPATPSRKFEQNDWRWPSRTKQFATN
jgi:hypothetical protein